MTESSPKKQVRKRVLFLGAGGWAREHWIDRVLPDFKDKLKIAGHPKLDEGLTPSHKFDTIG